MTDKPLRIKLVNMHQSNHIIHAHLQNDANIDILLIQELWYGTIATTRSDTDPTGNAILGTPHNPAWDLHLPQLQTGEISRVLAYTKKTLV
jgi:hypothetical protein